MKIEDIKTLRETTGAGVMDAKKALEEAEGDVKKALEILKEKGIQKAEKKSERELKAGRVFSYIHMGGKVGAMVKIGCETDFVAKNEEFAKLGNEITMQSAAMKPQSVKELLDQDYIRDSSKKVSDLVTETIAKIGENISIIEVSVFEV